VKGEIPPEHVIQVQSGLLISEREWCHFLSYSGGLPMDLIPAEPIPEFQEAIIEAATAFEARVAEVIAAYHDAVKARGLHPTERRAPMEIIAYEPAANHRRQERPAECRRPRRGPAHDHRHGGEGQRQPEQPVSIHFEGDDGKPFKPCKTCRRLLVHCWGAEATTTSGAG
jgi:hypothetical protein